MKLTESFKGSTLRHPLTRPIRIADANTNSNFFVRRHWEARLNTSLKPLEVANNTCAHGKSIRCQDNVIDETAMVQPLFPCGIPVNRAQQANRSLIKAQAATSQCTIINAGGPNIRRPKWRRLCSKGLASRRGVHKIRKRIFSKYLNPPRLIIANAWCPAGILKNALNLRPCRTARAERPYGSSRGDGVQNCIVQPLP